MKKTLLSIVAVGACIASGYAQDYGTSPETAVPWGNRPMGWFLPTLENAPAEAYFTYTNTLTSPILWGDAPSNPDAVPGEVAEKQVWVYLCDGGQEAFQMSEGSDSYVLLPGQEYLVKIMPKYSGMFCFNQPMSLPESMMGKRKYYPQVIPTTEMNLARTLAPGETAWYQIEVPYPTQLAFNYMMVPVMDVANVEAIHIECPGGTNVGDAIALPYVKAGKNVVGVTASADVAEDVKFIIGYNAMMTLNCSNNLLRGKSLELDAKNTYPDAYYTVDRFFTVPEDGTYTFTNHGAAGTILNVGMVVPDPENPDNPMKGLCDWSDIKSATVGNNDAVIVVDNLKAGETVAVQSDAFGVIGKGMEDQPYLMVQKGNASGVDGVAVEGDALKVAAANGRLSVESVLLASGAEVAVYDMQAKKVASAVAAEGASSIEMPLDVTSGVYVVVVYGKGNSESAKFVVK